jgi:hypothetical protein
MLLLKKWCCRTEIDTKQGSKAIFRDEFSAEIKLDLVIDNLIEGVSFGDIKFITIRIKEGIDGI